MKSQRLKDLYLTVISPAAITSRALWCVRLRSGIPQSLRRGEDGQVWLNLGSGAKPLAAYVNREVGWFSDFPSRFESLRGKFSNFLFCDGQHRLGFDFSLMEEALVDAGF